mmetsp:Transcript_3851/g.8105  ORF Transcript_3851/g.8105 Transcript_3851/m.8105 type:complete len:129 (-) Transcript_3851:124-510(-)
MRCCQSSSDRASLARQRRQGDVNEASSVRRQWRGASEELAARLWQGDAGGTLATKRRRWQGSSGGGGVGDSKALLARLWQCDVRGVDSKAVVERRWKSIGIRCCQRDVSGNASSTARHCWHGLINEAS